MQIQKKKTWTQSNSPNVASSNDNADPPDVSLPSSSRGVYWDLEEKIKIAPTVESNFCMKILFLRMTYGGNSCTFSRERQFLIPKQENFSIN